MSYIVSVPFSVVKKKKKNSDKRVNICIYNPGLFNAYIVSTRSNFQYYFLKFLKAFRRQRGHGLIQISDRNDSINADFISNVWVRTFVFWNLPLFCLLPDVQVVYASCFFLFKVLYQLHVWKYNLGYKFIIQGFCHIVEGLSRGVKNTIQIKATEQINFPRNTGYVKTDKHANQKLCHVRHNFAN